MNKNSMVIVLNIMNYNMTREFMSLNHREIQTMKR